MYEPSLCVHCVRDRPTRSLGAEWSLCWLLTPPWLKFAFVYLLRFSVVLQGHSQGECPFFQWGSKVPTDDELRGGGSSNMTSPASPLNHSLGQHDLGPMHGYSMCRSDSRDWGTESHSEEERNYFRGRSLCGYDG